MAAGEVDVARLQQVPIDLIDPGDNDRKIFNDMKLVRLAASIAAKGLTSKGITVRPHPDCPGRYQVVEGDRRTRAWRLLQKRDPVRYRCIPAWVRDDLTEEQVDDIMWAENHDREQLDVIEEAEAFQKRIDKHGYTIAQVAERCGVTEDLVKRRLKLLNLMPEAQHLVRFGNMPLKHAEQLARLEHNFQQVAFRSLGDKKGISEEKFKDVVNTLDQMQSQLSMFDDDSVFFQHEAGIQRKVELIFANEEPTTSYFTIQSNGCTIHISVQHPKGKAATLNETLIRQAVKLKGAT